MCSQYTTLMLPPLSQEILKVNFLIIFILQIGFQKNMADLKWSLDEALGNTGVEIMTISHPEAYGEYAPYHFVQTEEEFIKQTLALRP